jgi:peroxiredoxin Q/BCP
MKIGDKAPEVLGTDANGREVRLSDYACSKVVLYFYPKDNTPGCTAEACSLRDGYEELRAAGYEVIGVSKDSATSHRRFAEKHNLPFTLIADTDLKLNEAFGVWREKKMCGRVGMGTVRTTFIIDENGVIADIIEKVKTAEHSQQILNNK